MTSLNEYDFKYDNDLKTLHYVQGGPADAKEVMIFLHGWPGIGKTWHKQLTAFAQRGYKVIAPDMPGWGRSTANKVISDYAQDRIVPAMLGLLKHLGYSQAIWVAHDWGCGTMWSLARRHPEVCKAVCAMTVPYATIEFGLQELLKTVDRKIYPESEYPFGQWSYQVWYEQEFEQVTKWYESDARGFLKAAFRKGSASNLGKPAPTSTVVRDKGRVGGAEKPPSADQIPDELAILDKETFEELVAACEKTGFWAGDAWYMNHVGNKAYNSANGGYDKRLQMPVLFIEAKYDTICETVDSKLPERQRELCDDLTFVSIDAGHFVAIEKWEETNKAIEQWLDKKGLLLN